MKTQPTMTKRGFVRGMFFLVLALAVFSPASLVCAQTATSKNPEKAITPESFNALMATVKEQQEQIRRQQREIDSLKKPGIPGTPAEDNSDPGLVVGSGTPVKHIISLTQSVNISDPNTYSIDITVPGAQPTDLVMVGVPENMPVGLIFKGTVLQANKVRVRVHSPLPAPKYPMPAMLLRVVVIGF